MRQRVGSPTYSDDRPTAGVDDTYGLVLAGGADEAAVAIPGRAVDEVGVEILQGDHGLAGAHVPDDDLVVTTCTPRPTTGRWS